MMTEKVFLIFSLLYLVVIGLESLLLILLYRKKKTLADHVHTTQKSYETRMRFHLIKLEDSIRKREEKIRDLEKQIELLKNDEEKQVLQEKIACLEREVKTLATELETLRKRDSTAGEVTETDFIEELFQVKERNIELEMQIEELKRESIQEQAFLREKLAAEQKQIQKLQHDLDKKASEIVQLREERDILRLRGSFLNK